MMSKAIRIHEHGGPEVLKYEEVDPGKPGRGEVLIEHSAIGLNFIDVYFRTGLYPPPGGSLPITPGGEGAGKVLEIGEGVERSDHVLALGGGVIGDLVGFACSIVKRGCAFVQVLPPSSER